MKALRLLARKLVDKAIGGDVMALKEIGDRLDGKTTQAVDLTGQVQIQAIERVIVQPQQLEHGPVPDTTPEIARKGNSQPDIVPNDDAAIVNNSGDSAK